MLSIPKDCIDNFSIFYYDSPNYGKHIINNSEAYDSFLNVVKEKKVDQINIELLNDNENNINNIDKKKDEDDLFNNPYKESFYEEDNKINEEDDKKQNSGNILNNIENENDYEAIEFSFLEEKKSSKDKNENQLNINNNINENKNNIKINNLIKDEIKKEEVPPLGLYNPDVITSIDYKIKKNAYESRNNNNIAFTTTFNKKKKKKNNIEVNCINSNLGPGYYYHEKRNIDTKLSPVFHLPEFKKNSNPNININVGPGKYNIDSYNEWSKKSFNINYV
jgi:hypothetical protein